MAECNRRESVQMSAYEIRRLANDPTFKAFVSDGPACIVVTSNVKSALLAYAAMVERCEAKLYSRRFDHYSPEIEDVKDFIKEMLVYIIRGDVAKEVSE